MLVSVSTKLRFKLLKCHTGALSVVNVDVLFSSILHSPQSTGCLAITRYESLILAQCANESIKDVS